MAKTAKRLPQGNINRLIEILRSKLRNKAREHCRESERNCEQGVTNYLAAAAKKHGLSSLVKLSLDKKGRIDTTLTPKVKADINRIKAPYKQVTTCNGHVYVPTNKFKAYEAAWKNLEDLEILLLTADSDEAVVMYDSAEQQIEGIK